MVSSIAFQFGQVDIKWYGLMMVLGLLLGFLLWVHLTREKGMKRVVALESYLVIIFGLFLGARIFHLLIYDFSSFLADPLKIFFIWQGGLASHGGLLGGTLFFYVYCKKKKMPFWFWTDIAMVPIVLATSFVRIGNFLNGEIVGRITNFPWGVKFNGESLKRHPVQLYESFKNFLIFGILYSIKGVKLPKGMVYWLFVFLFSFLRFFTEFFKEYMVFTSGLTMGQWLSLILVIISGIMLYLVWKKKIVLK